MIKERRRPMREDEGGGAEDEGIKRIDKKKVRKNEKA